MAVLKEIEMKLTTILLAMFLLVGCAYVKKGDLTYIRWGDQKISHLEVTTGDGSSLTMDGQESKADAALRILEAIE